MSDVPPPRTHRIGIFGPFILLCLAFAAWSGYWFYVADQVGGRIKAHQQVLVQQGYSIRYDPWRMQGYPFRMFLDLRNVTVIAPSGKGFAAPQLEAEANAYALDKWVLVAPKGLTLYRGRPDGADWGTLAVTGTSLKASVSGLTRPIYSVAIVGSGLSLTPSDPARPFGFSSAESVEAYARPTVGVADSADFLVRVGNARGQPESLTGQLSPDKPLNLHVEGALSHVSAYDSGVTAWRNAGGTVGGFHAQLTAGDLNLDARSDALTFDDSHHVSGRMAIEMSGSFQPLSVLAALHLISAENMTLAKPLIDMTLATQGTQKFALDFHDGGAYIGPLKVSDAPIVP